MKNFISLFKFILIVKLSVFVFAASAEDSRLLKEFYPTLIPTAIHNGTTLDNLIENTRCETLPERPFINDPDGNYVFDAQKAYCALVESAITLDKEDKELKRFLIAGQLQRIKHIIDLHTDGEYVPSTPNPTTSQWRSLISGNLDPSGFGAVEVEIQKVIKARDELNRLGIANFAIFAFIKK